MKMLKYIISCAMAALLASCESDVDTPQIYNPDKFVAPVVGKCNDVIVNADNSNAENVVFTWSAADFGQPVQILYSLYVASGETSALVSTSNTTNLTVAKGDLNGAVINGLGIPANSTAEVTAFVTAKMANTDDYEAIKSGMSNSFKITTYSAPLKWLYLCGEFCWYDNEGKIASWDIANAPVFYETSGGSNTYKCMIDLTKGDDKDDKDKEHSYFKVTVGQNWSDGDWGYGTMTPSWTCKENNDKNFSIPFSEGNIFELTVNKTVLTIDRNIIGKSIGLVGSFNNWGNDGEPDVAFVYDYKSSAWITEKSVTLTADAEIKVRVDGAWTLSWGDSGKRSTAISQGYELVSNGNNNIKVTTAGTYNVKLHANRTPYVLELIAQ